MTNRVVLTHLPAYSSAELWRTSEGNDEKSWQLILRATRLKASGAVDIEVHNSGSHVITLTEALDFAENLATIATREWVE